ncbi:hypothetical protein KEM54_005896 [Ascosphaera aggregata]|nr:hypothetical protein KEM54_005896 [Ascosphaera aggregata]
MKPVVSALNAWSCFIISLFGIVILSVIGSLFRVRALRMAWATTALCPALQHTPPSFA